MNFMDIKKLMIKTHRAVIAILTLESEYRKAWKSIESDLKEAPKDDSSKEQ